MGHRPAQPAALAEPGPAVAQAGAPAGPPARAARRPGWERALLRAPAHEVLGVPREASRDQIGGLPQRLEDYRPDKLAGMDAELQALAERRTRELRRAYEDMLDRLS